MARLSKSTSERMAKALVRHRFQKRAEELTAESVALYDAVYAERYDTATQGLMAKLLKLHADAFPKANNGWISARGLNVHIGGAQIGCYKIVTWSANGAERPVFRSQRGTVSDALASRIHEYAMSTKAFDDDLRAAYSRALSTLNSLGTDKRLQEEWPEALPVIGHLIPVENRSLPVVQLAAINDEFGLPPSELEAA